MDNIKIISIEVLYRDSEPPYTKLTIKVNINGEIKYLIIDNYELNFQDRTIKGFSKYSFLKLVYKLNKVNQSGFNRKRREQITLYKSKNDYIQECELKSYKSFNYYNFIINKLNN